jgi:hypothetical protein
LFCESLTLDIFLLRVFGKSAPRPGFQDPWKRLSVLISFPGSSARPPLAA